MQSPGQTCFYDLLGVSSDASTSELRAGYLRSAQQCHPDLNRGSREAEQQFKRLRRVYELLIDPVQRATYDEDPSRYQLTATGVVLAGTKTIISRPDQPATSHINRQWTPANSNASAPTATPLGTPWDSSESRLVEHLTMTAVGLIAIIGLSTAGYLGFRIHRAQIDRNQSFHPSMEPPRVRSTTAVSSRGVNPSPPEHAPERRRAHNVTQVNSTEIAMAADSSRSVDSELPTMPTIEMLDYLDVALPGWPPIFELPPQTEHGELDFPDGSGVTLPQPDWNDQSHLPKELNFQQQQSSAHVPPVATQDPRQKPLSRLPISPTDFATHATELNVPVRSLPPVSVSELDIRQAGYSRIRAAQPPPLIPATPYAYSRSRTADLNTNIGSSFAPLNPSYGFRGGLLPTSTFRAGPPPADTWSGPSATMFHRFGPGTATRPSDEYQPGPSMRTESPSRRRASNRATMTGTPTGQTFERRGLQRSNLYSSPWP